MPSSTTLCSSFSSRSALAGKDEPEPSRFGRVQETVRKAVSKGLRITVGYALLLVLLGCVREWLAAGTMFGVVVSRPVLPMASMPAGGFIVLGVLCAVWRALAQKRKAYLTKEARNLVDVHSQKEADREQ